MAAGDRNDPYRSFNFKVEAGGQLLGHFSEVSGLTAEGDSVDYREGTDVQNSVRKLIAMRKYTTVTLRRGYTKNRDLWDWYRNILNGVPDRRLVTITLLDDARQPVLAWNLQSAWLNKVEGPALKASGNEVAMESVELVHEGLMLE